MFPRLVTKSANVPLTIMRTAAEAWISDQPASAEPHYLLAAALADRGNRAEAEQEANRAVDLVLSPHPYDSSERVARQRAFRLRAGLRAERGDLAGAIADARMAQLVAEDQAGADDLTTEAELWQRLGYAQKARAMAAQAYALGSLKAEAVLKQAFVARGGTDAGFSEHLLDVLRAADTRGSGSLRPVPAFSASTLTGATVDPPSLRGKVTVIDFWFTGCAPCAAERPMLNALVAELGERVRFLSFALDAPDRLKTYLQATPFQYEIVPNSEAIAQAFDVRAFPTHMVLDRRGNIVWIAGTDEDRLERLRAMVYRVLARPADGSY
jgi:thiol-disulfide isomerase/thioredoxin